MVGSVPAEAPRRSIPSEGIESAPAADVQSAHDHRREPRRGPDAPLAARAPDEPARARARGRRHAAPRQLRRERPREPEPRDGARAGPRARRAAARAQPDAARRRLRAALPRDRARRDGDGRRSGPRSTGCSRSRSRIPPSSWTGTGTCSRPTTRPRRCSRSCSTARRPSPPNVVRLMFTALRPHVANFEQTGEALVQRVHREAVGGHPGPADDRRCSTRSSPPGRPGGVADAGLRDHAVARAADAVRQARRRRQLLLARDHGRHAAGRDAAGDPARVVLPRRRGHRAYRYR